jgi:hypothetical protein
MKWKLKNNVWTAAGKRWIYGYADKMFLIKSHHQTLALTLYAKNLETAKAIAKLLEK